MSKVTLPNSVQLTPQRCATPAVCVENRFGKFVIELDGGHLTYFKQNDQLEQLWMSEASNKSWWRGGLQVCVPFGEGHGIPRTLLWTLTSAEETQQSTIVEISLVVNEVQHRVPNGFSLLLGAELDIEGLHVWLTQKNLGDENMRSDKMFHPYPNISAASNIAIEGLGGFPYFDRNDQNKLCNDSSHRIYPYRNMNRLYNGCRNVHFSLDDYGQGFDNRRLHFNYRSTSSAALWVPWDVESDELPYISKDNVARVASLEGGTVGDDALIIQPGQSDTIELSMYTD